MSDQGARPEASPAPAGPPVPETGPSGSEATRASRALPGEVHPRAPAEAGSSAPAAAPSPVPPPSNPALVTEVRGEISPRGSDAWQPTSYREWEDRERAKTFLAAWSEQMSHERSLRSFSAKWIFALIVLQVVATFLLVLAQGLGWIEIDKQILQVLIPSVLAEVFGLGFLVVKYLFSQPLRHGLDSLVHGSHDAPRPPDGA